jgi:chloramphenicol 3-O-phosphotransferase
MTITIISGPPATGKTTLARALAERDPAGAHLATDQFYDFLAHPVDPSTPASRAQNETVVRAFIGAAKAYAAGGYTVFVDGVIGPWWLPLLQELLGGFDYVLLRSELETALERAATRPGQPGARPAVVREMHQQFARLFDTYPQLIIETGGRARDEIVTEFITRQRRGDFQVP